MMKEQIRQQPDSFKQDLAAFRFLNRLYAPFGTIYAFIRAQFPRIRRAVIWAR
jgi:hypothetical protein